MNSSLLIMFLLFINCLAIVYILRDIEQFAVGTCVIPSSDIVLPYYTENTIVLNQCDDDGDRKVFESDILTAYFKTPINVQIKSPVSVPASTSYNATVLYYTVNQKGEEQEVVINQNKVLTSAQVNSMGSIDVTLPTGKMILQLAIKLKAQA
jgi:hypothetical protein